MSWVKLTDKLHDNDKLGSVSDAAFRLWVLALVWSNDKLTDGHVPTQRPMRLMTLRNPDKTIAELVEARLWHRSSSPCRACVKQREEKKADAIPSGGFLIHDYFEYQRAAWVIRAERETKSRVGRLGGEARWNGTVPSSVPATVPSSVPSTADTKRALRDGTVPSTADAPVPPYSRSPVTRGSLDPVSTGGAGGERPRDDEPEIPDQDPTPRRSKERGGTGLRHLSEVTDRVTRDAGRRAKG